MAVSGAPGTGKTTLAMQLALEKARKKEGILYLCWTHVMKDFLTDFFTKKGQGIKIEVATIYWICKEWLGLKDDKDLDDSHKQKIYETLCRIIHEKGITTIIVDEGHEFGTGMNYIILYSLYCIMCGDKPKWGKGIQDNQLALLRNKVNDINAKSFFIFTIKCKMMRYRILLRKLETKLS